jgi:hypothetical protein
MGTVTYMISSTPVSPLDFLPFNINPVLCFNLIFSFVNGTDTNMNVSHDIILHIWLCSFYK